MDADKLLKVADDYSGTAASARALLVAAGQLFESGKVAEAQAGFEKFVGQYSGHPLMSQAKLGIAVCLHSQGKTNEAAVAFKEVVDRFTGEQTATPAKFYLASLYEAQGKPEMARDLFMDLARTSQTTFGQQAMARLNDMFQKNPQLRPGAVSPPPVTLPPATSATP